MLVTEIENILIEKPLEIDILEAEDSIINSLIELYTLNATC